MMHQFKTLDDPVSEDSPWSCYFVMADNADPSLFNSADTSADYVWAGHRVRFMPQSKYRHNTLHAIVTLYKHDNTS